MEHLKAIGKVCGGFIVSEGNSNKDKKEQQN
jgi:hypothetical protein